MHSYTSGHLVFNLGFLARLLFFPSKFGNYIGPYSFRQPDVLEVAGPLRQIL